MYQLIKKKAIKVIPETFIRTNEKTIRNILSILYRGNNFICNLCHTGLRSFATLETGDLLCPRCGSLGRHRRLGFILESLKLSEEQDYKILHFSPSKSVKELLSGLKNLSYSTSDYDKDSHTDHHFDITNIHQQSNTYDLIICYHILEHIEDDAAAAAELYRILKPGGLVLVQTPFKEGETYEDNNIITPEQRKVHFGQEDHVRIYSLKGLEKVLSNAGFQVFIKSFENDEDFKLQHGLKQEEAVIFARKE